MPFVGCIALKALIFLRKLLELGKTLYGCEALASITVDTANTVYDSRYASNAIIDKKTDVLLFGCKETVIPSSVKAIGPNAFRENTALTTFTVPVNVKPLATLLSLVVQTSVLNYTMPLKAW